MGQAIAKSTRRGLNPVIQYFHRPHRRSSQNNVGDKVVSQMNYQFLQVFGPSERHFQSCLRTRADLTIFGSSHTTLENDFKYRPYKNICFWQNKHPNSKETRKITNEIRKFLEYRNTGVKSIDLFVYSIRFKFRRPPTTVCWL